MPANQEPVTPMTVAELVSLRRFQKYQRRRRFQSEERVQRLQTSCAVRARLTRGRHALQNALAEATSSESKQDFSTLFHSFHTIKKACDEYDDHVLSSSSPDDGHTSLAARGVPLDRISNHARTVLVNFISDVASDSDFLVNRLLSLSSIDLTRLLKAHPQSSPDQSVFGHQSPEPGRKTTGSIRSGTTSDALETFLDFSRHDALSLLLQIVAHGNPSQGFGLSKCRIQAWGEICARLLSEQKPGGEKFVAAVLTAWSPELEPSGKHILETWLLNTIQEGDFLSRTPEKYSFRTRVLGRDDSTTDEDDCNAFLEKSLENLLDIIKDTAVTGLIPSRSLKLGRTLVNGLDEAHRQQQTALFCVRWLFSYLIKIIRVPESQGLLLSYHISTHVRKRILYEIALRMEKLVFAVSHTWKQSCPISPRLLEGMSTIVSLFGQTETIKSDHCTKQHVVEAEDAQLESRTSPDMLTLCSAEVVHLIQSLYPEIRSHVDASFGRPKLQSSASSVSGLSLFRTTTDGDCSSILDPKFCISEGSLVALDAQGSPFCSRTLQAEESTNTIDPFEAFDPDCRAMQLKRICEELAEVSGSRTNLGSCEPLSEEWMTFALTSENRPSFEIEPHSADEHPRGDIALQPPDRKMVLDPVELDLELQIEMRDAIFSLLDDFIAAEGPSRPIQAYDFPPSDIKQTAEGYFRSNSSNIDSRNGQAVKPTAASVENQPWHGQPGNLLAHLEKAAHHCKQRGDYNKAHYYFRVLRKHRADKPLGILSALYQVSLDMKRSIRKSASVIADCEAQIERLTMSQYQQLSILRRMTLNFEHFREKIWYACDVKSTGHYEDLRRMVSALRTMGLPPRPNKSPPQPLLRHRQGSKMLSAGVQLKAEAATLEFLAALPGHGGPNKLSDNQAESTGSWIQNHRIENICRGEERLHRFCQEIAKCVDIFIGESVTENPVLWSSELFRGQQRPSSSHLRHHFNSSHPESTATERFQALYSPHRPVSRGSDATFAHRWSPPPLMSRPNSVLLGNSPLHGWSVQDRFGSRSPTLTDDSSTTFWSPMNTEAQSPSSVTTLPSRALSPSLSIRSVQSRGSHIENNQVGFLQNLKRRLTSLLLSDFGHLFRYGSETDAALWDTLDGKEAAKCSTNFDTQLSDKDNALNSEASPDHNGSSDGFDYKAAFSGLLQKFTLQPDPIIKLECLAEIQSLLLTLNPEELSGASIEESECTGVVSTQDNTMASSQGPVKFGTFAQERPVQGESAAVHGFQRLFQDCSLRPRSLFRDLQYIASLVPSHTLDSSNQGRAFCNATFAAVSLKQKICQGMIETADDIISYHTSSRGHSYVTSALQAERDSATFASTPPTSTAIATASEYSMTDAAQLLQITAREGNPVAQRELATLYLTHPELMTRVIAPLTRPRDVFKDGTVETKGRKDVGQGKYDPLTMAVAQHWMELSAKGGDGLAAKYLKAKADPLISEG